MLKFFSSTAVEKMKETLGEAKGTSGKKKVDKQEEQLRNNSRDLNMVKMKSMLVIGFTFTALMGMLSTMYVHVFMHVVQFALFMYSIEMCVHTNVKEICISHTHIGDSILFNDGKPFAFISDQLHFPSGFNFSIDSTNSSFNRHSILV